MKIGLLGYGKMGKAIEEIAIQRKHEIVLRITAENKNKITTENLQKADVLIEFSRPESAVKNINTALEAKVPIVVGTTGWYDSYNDVVSKAERNEGALLTASNFSIGVNLFFELNRQLARVMNDYPDYLPSMKEIHHTQKLDAPSGTAITLGEVIIQENNSLDKWVNEKTKDASALSIESFREEDVPGTHEINYTSEIDEISIKHTAFSRKGFAMGSVVAAEWLQNKKGVYKMSDVLNVNFG